MLVSLCPPGCSMRWTFCSSNLLRIDSCSTHSSLNSRCTRESMGAPTRLSQVNLTLMQNWKLPDLSHSVRKIMASSTGECSQQTLQYVVIAWLPTLISCSTNYLCTCLCPQGMAGMGSITACPRPWTWVSCCRRCGAYGSSWSRVSRRTAPSDNSWSSS